MAQWSLADRTLYAKLVYYGPALGGKTTNLRAVHAATDPEGRRHLVSVNTADDRTLFFDLLPFDLGSLLGYKVALKLFTVPGQSRYDATRRAVLAGADAVVFVADSDATRERDNRSSWSNLKENMRAARLDPGVVPILTQFNKRDLPGAAPVAALEAWLDLPAGAGVPAVACEGRGVLETLVAASHAMIERIVSMAEPRTRRTLRAGDLKAQLDAAFAPYIARSLASGPGVEGDRGSVTPLVLADTDLLESAVASSVALGAQLTDQHDRAARLEREAESFRVLSEAVRASGASFDRGRVLDAALGAVAATLPVAGAAVCGLDSKGRLIVDRGLGRGVEILAADNGAATFLTRLIASRSATVVDDVGSAIPASAPRMAELRALAVVPVEPLGYRSLVVAMPGPDGAIEDTDVRFLATVAGHVAVGLEKVRIHDELRAHRDRLEDVVGARTRALRRAYDELKALEATKDRFLANVSHEMRSPLTAIIGAATFLRDYGGGGAEGEEMTQGILQSALSLTGLVDSLLRVGQLDAGGTGRIEPVAPAEVVAEALRLAGAEARVSVLIDPGVESIPADPPRLARALGNLLDNALKFGGAGEPIELRVGPCLLNRPSGATAGVLFSVLDRGPGLAEADVERAFAPFEQGGDPMTGKPGGVGLGLYEARRIAQGHGGALVYRPRPGGGSQFWLSLPAEAIAAESVRTVHRA